MKTEQQAWEQLRRHAADRLSPGFADRILRITHGCESEAAAWSQLQQRAATELRPGFPLRVLQAARAAATPSFSSQFMLSAATASVCLFAVVFEHQRATNDADARSLAVWQEISLEAQDFDLAQ